MEFKGGVVFVKKRWRDCGRTRIHRLRNHGIKGGPSAPFESSQSSTVDFQHHFARSSTENQNVQGLCFPDHRRRCQRHELRLGCTSPLQSELPAHRVHPCPTGSDCPTARVHLQELPSASARRPALLHRPGRPQLHRGTSIPRLPRTRSSFGLLDYLLLDFLFCLSELFIPTIPSIRSIKTDLRFFLLNPIVGVSSLSRYISQR